MLTHRCPWCGEKMNLRLPFFVENPIWWRGKEPLHCPACKRRYRSKSNWFKRILTTVAVILLCGGAAGMQLLLHPYRVFWPFEITACIILMIMNGVSQRKRKYQLRLQLLFHYSGAPSQKKVFGIHLFNVQTEKSSRFALWMKRMFPSAGHCVLYWTI